MLTSAPGVRGAAPATGPSAPPPVVYFHLPGISGPMPGDRSTMAALVKAGVAPAAEIVDWTAPNPGVAALGNTAKNKAEARALAGRITALCRADARQRVIVSGHSGGVGVAVWTLEALPPDVKVDQLLLLAGALSPGYDLSSALSHVRTHAWNFHSTGDQIVLSTLTRNFGTIDRVKADACGFTPFVAPARSDPVQYAKLTQFAYDPAWESLDHDGGHMGTLHRRFAARVLAPLLLTGRLPVVTTRPATVPVR